MAMASTKRRCVVSWRPRNIAVPSYRPTQRDGYMETMHQLVPDSGEGQHTETVDDYHRMERREAHAMRSPSLLVTIFYYSIPSGMRRGASYIIKGLQPTAYSVRCAPASRRG